MQFRHETHRLAFGATILLCVKLLNNAKAPDYEIVDFESSDSCAADHQPPYGDGADGHRTNRQCAKRYRSNSLSTNCLCPNCFGSNAYLREMGGLGLASGSPILVDACVGFVRGLQ
ncbi:MAG: hypothetical protein ACAH88_15590 [Roseimicrobium sp.]